METIQEQKSEATNVENVNNIQYSGGGGKIL